MQQQRRNLVLLGIQARSTSHRLPRKAFADIGGKPLLEHVIDSCKRAAWYCNKTWNGIQVKPVLLIPFGDEIRTAFGVNIPIHEGPENNVLTRYVEAAQKLDASYICRVTGDCPLIPPYLISKIIKLAVVNGYDYISNVDPGFRMSPDGHDCEVMSREMLDYLDTHAQSTQEREHVTLHARTTPPSWARIGHVEGHLDLSGMKFSVDTQEDLDRVRAEYEKIHKKVEDAQRLFGREAVHRL